MTYARKILVVWLAVLATAVGLTAGSAAAAGTTLWKTSDPLGNAIVAGKFFDNNEWNAGTFGPQTIWVDSPTHWGVVSDQPDTSEVKVYPEEARDFSVAWSHFTTLRSTFTQSGPDAGDWEAAYDIWLAATPGSAASTEVMIWVDNHGQTPLGKPVATARVGGQSWQLWYGDDGHPVYSFVLGGLTKAHETRGSVDIRGLFDWLAGHHDITTAMPLEQLAWGWEICSTAGASRTFETTGYSLTATS